jgi:hypothetical protein
MRFVTPLATHFGLGDSRCTLAYNSTFFRNFSEIDLVIRLDSDQNEVNTILTLPLLLYRMQLIKNLNCSSLEAGAILPNNSTSEMSKESI